jgi:rfaE bifunctional protein kinase chain/domain
MNNQRFLELTARFAGLKLAIVGDFCLDRYLEIDPARAEISIETGLTVHNVVRVRSQPGGAGTILNNLVALGIGEIYAVGFAGEDGEGWELVRALKNLAHVRLDHFLITPERRTFTYTKPLLCNQGKIPEELNRLDFKNWTPAPGAVESHFCEALRQLSAKVDGFIFLEQVDLADTGVITKKLLEKTAEVVCANPQLLVIADSRRGLKHFPAVTLKMNRDELARMMGQPEAPDLETAKTYAHDLARQTRRSVFVTLAKEGLLGSDANGQVHHMPSLPVRGPIDIVGAGDAVTANLASALAAGAALREALELANAAASVVIHQIGTTGTARTDDICPLISES